MNLTNLKKEYDMQLKDRIKCTKAIKNLSHKDETLNYLYQECLKQLISNNSINDSTFINFTKRIIEMEDSENVKCNCVWVVECTATVYKSIDK